MPDPYELYVGEHPVDMTPAEARAACERLEAFDAETTARLEAMSKERAMNDKPELKPCPFCGGEACCSPSTESDEPEREDREPLLWGVGCGCTAFVGPWSTEAEAIAAWNTRIGPQG